MKNILFLINTILLSLKRNRKLRNIDGPIKVNLGCGLTVTKGWINIDGSLNSLVSRLPEAFIRLIYRYTGANQSFDVGEYVNIVSNNDFIHHDLRDGLPFGSNTLSHVYSSHFIEHLNRDEATNLLGDAYDALVSGGKIRISVPDLEYAISLYPDNKKDMMEKYFFINDKANTFSNHKYMYDFDSMSTMLSRIGFRDIVRGDFAEGDFPNVDLLDNRCKDSLFVEAIK
ncbi:MAG: hypothetical protein COB04_01270 [Gammaproteobacteria bacterium]|nr:MAG: hypothetical protein COB04_01270 [Gammaproteobacteria bacterium]